jgi:hypothetical protein
MQFAASVAAGKPLVAAYREVYQPANGKAPSTYRNAKRAAKHPGISARIEELELERFPAVEDMRAVYEHGLAVIVRLSKTAKDSRVQLQAGMWLCAEAEKRAALEASRLEKVRPPERREDVIAELRAIYQRALPNSDPAPLVEEVRAEAEGEGR